MLQSQIQHSRFTKRSLTAHVTAHRGLTYTHTPCCMGCNGHWHPFFHEFSCSHNSYNNNHNNQNNSKGTEGNCSRATSNFEQSQWSFSNMKERLHNQQYTSTATDLRGCTAQSPAGLNAYLQSCSTFSCKLCCCHCIWPQPQYWSKFGMDSPCPA